MSIKAKTSYFTLICLFLLFTPVADMLKPAFAADNETAWQPVTSLYIPHKFHSFKDHGRVDPSKMTTFGSQTVTVLEQGGQHEYLISTYLGPRWIYYFENYEKIVDPYLPYSYEQMIADSLKLAGMYPDIISVYEIGRSVEDRQIITIQLGKGTRHLIMVGSHHAREYISSTYLMKMVDEYAYAYHTTGKFGNYDIKTLLNAVTIHVVVMLNPDGVNLVQNGPESVHDRAALDKIKMLKPSYREWKSNINGINLNANYPAEWDLKRSTVRPDSETFKGYKAGSEPEVRALMQYTRKFKFLLAASFHSKGEVVYWADNLTEFAFDGQRKIAEAITKTTGYMLLPVSRNPGLYAGGYENWFRAEFNRPAYCIELTPTNGNNNPHDDADFDALVWNKAKFLGAVLAAECRR